MGDRTGPRRPATRDGFEIAIICALTLEAEAVEALFDRHWDDNDDDGAAAPYDKAKNDPNAYSTGVIGRHNVVLAHMSGMGKVSAAAVAANCNKSFPNIRLAIVVGICGVVPLGPDGEERILGDVIISDGVVQYDFGWQMPERFVRKDTLLDVLGRPNVEIRGLLAKLKTRRERRKLSDGIARYLHALQTEGEPGSEYPGAASDKLFKADYQHVTEWQLCEDCGCNGVLVPRRRLLGEDATSVKPAVHFGLVASGDKVMKSGEERDAIARQEGVVAFEMEASGVWDSFPCVVIKGACDYADSHKSKVWQPYAAATAAACMKAFLGHWVPSPSGPEAPSERPRGPWFLVPYPRNDSFVGRTSLLSELKKLSRKSASQARAAIYGLGGIGKTQIALEYAYSLRKECPDTSVFWVHASNAERFRQGYTSIAQECQVPGRDDPKTDMLPLVKTWLEKEQHGRWLMVIDNADDTELFFAQRRASKKASASSHEGELGRYLPDCSHGAILVTTRNLQAGSRLTQGRPPIEVGKMDGDETAALLGSRLGGFGISPEEIAALSSRLEHLPLALIQAAAFIQENRITVREYLGLLDKSDQHVTDLLGEHFETVGRDREALRSIAETWVVSFEQIQRQDKLAAELLSLMSLFDRQSIPLKFLTIYCEEQEDEQRGGDLQLTKALGLLKAFSFITADNGNNFDMHRLVQLVTREWLANKEKTDLFAEQALLVVSKAYPYGEYETRAVCREYLPHADAVLRSEGTGSRDAKLARAELLHRVAGYFDYLGRWKDAERCQVEAMGIRKNILGDEHRDTLYSMSGLTWIYRARGLNDHAKSLGMRAMKISKKVLGDEDYLTLQIMDTLGLTYRDQGRWKEAEALLVQVLETTKRVLGDEHPNTLGSMYNLALTWSGQGRWEEAESLQVQVLETSKRVLGDEHPNTLTSMNNLANTWSEQGRWKETESLQVQVLKTRKRVQGDEHPDTLRSMYSLAITWYEQGRLPECLPLMEQCVQLEERILGPDHPDTIASSSSLRDWQTESAQEESEQEEGGREQSESEWIDTDSDIDSAGVSD